jgi:hypothetical protein
MSILNKQRGAAEAVTDPKLCPSSAEACATNFAACAGRSALWSLSPRRRLWQGGPHHNSLMLLNIYLTSCSTSPQAAGRPFPSGAEERTKPGSDLLAGWTLRFWAHAIGWPAPQSASTSRPPGLTRPSTSILAALDDVDARL